MTAVSSSIPPPVVGPAAQSTIAQHQSARILDTERQQQSHATESGSRISAETAESIEATDQDTIVHTDAGGTGSQGRHTATHHEPTQNTADEKSSGITTDDQGQPHVDLEA